MSTLLNRFVSRSGPDKPAVPDIRYLKGLPFDFKKAVEAKDRVQAELNQRYPSYRAVLYRMTRYFDQLYIWRQRPDSEDGNQHHPDEPAANAKKVGYFIVTTPEDLVHDEQADDDAALSDAVRAICIDFGQRGAPDPAGPHIVAPPPVK